MSSAKASHAGEDYRIPVRLIVPLEGKAKGFHITGGNSAEFLSKDINPNTFDARLLANGIGIVKTVVKTFEQIPGKQGLQQEMKRLFVKDLNPRYTTIWIWSMTLMRATTAAYAEVDYFEKNKAQENFLLNHLAVHTGAGWIIEIHFTCVVEGQAVS